MPGLRQTGEVQGRHGAQLTSLSSPHHQATPSAWPALLPTADPITAAPAASRALLQRSSDPARSCRRSEIELESVGGKLFESERTQRVILGMLLKNVGMDVVVQLGDMTQEEKAVATAEREPGDG